MKNLTRYIANDYLKRQKKNKKINMNLDLEFSSTAGLKWLPQGFMFVTQSGIGFYDYSAIVRISVSLDTRVIHFEMQKHSKNLNVSWTGALAIESVFDAIRDKWLQYHMTSPLETPIKALNDRLNNLNDRLDRLEFGPDSKVAKEAAEHFKKGAACNPTGLEPPAV